MQTPRQLLQIYSGGGIPTTVPKVFLGHPTLLDADSTEGAMFSASPDTSVSIPVVVVGPHVPVAGDLVIAHAIGGQWVVGDGETVTTRCPDVPCVGNLGASIPNKDLVFSWTGVAPVGSGTVPFIASCAGSWDTGCVGYNGLIRFTMVLSASGTSQVDVGYNQYATVCGGTSFPHAKSNGYNPGAPYPFTLTDSFSSPFDILFSDGFRSITISDPSPDVQCCLMYFVVTGDCDGLALPGSTVSVWTDSSKATLIDSGTVFADGSYSANLSSHAGSIYYEVSHLRYTTSSTTLTVACGDYFGDLSGFGSNPRSVTLVHDTTYVCVTGSCSTPIAKTLHATHPKFGPITLTYNAAGSLGAGWYDTVTYSYPGCFACPAKTVTVTCYLNLSLVYSDHWKSN
jgi:hypothetical protein